MLLENNVSQIIAHRGASHYAPENTMAAFNKAVEFGCHWLEFDVMLAKDGTPIIFHDSTLNRTTNGKGSVSQYDYAELSKLDAGLWFGNHFQAEIIPTFQQVCELLLEKQIQAVIEIKPAVGQEIITAQKIAELVSTKYPKLLAKCIFSSFSYQSLKEARRLMPTAQLAYTINAVKVPWRRITKELKCHSLHVNHAKLTPRLVTEIKKHGLHLFCYTVNDVLIAKHLFDLGVDAIFTDDVLQFIQQKEAF